MNPDSKVTVNRPGHGTVETDQTNAKFFIGGLTPEVLRDIARNEAAEWAWRKAAVKFLLSRDHSYANHTDLSELLAEIKEEQEAELEVMAVVESATEQPLEP